MASRCKCEDRYVNPDCAPDYLSVDFAINADALPARYFAPLWEAHWCRPACPGAREAGLLGLKTSDPCLIVARRTSNRGVPITQARLVHPAGHYQIEGVFNRQVGRWWRVMRLPRSRGNNGGGVTRELLAWPTASEWTVRLSVADITRDGPFSAFAGIDRALRGADGCGRWLGSQRSASTAMAR